MKGQLKDVSTPAEYIAALDEPRRSEIARIDRFIRETVPQLGPHVHGGMLGYGKYHYRYATGRVGDWFRVGLASNKSYISLYTCACDDRGYIAERFKPRLPKASVGKSCVRFKRFDDLDPQVVRELLLATAAAPTYAT